MGKSNGLLDLIFSLRVDDISKVSKEDLEKINKMKTIVKIEKYFPNFSSEEITQIEKFVDIEVDNIAFEMAFLNEKYYKKGFADGIKLLMECIKK